MTSQPPPTLTVPAPLGEQGSRRYLSNPYPGARAFTPAESHLYFGRDEQIDAVVRRLIRGRFVAVVGAAGSGKSSLLNAGIVPALLNGRTATRLGVRWRVAVASIGDDPFVTLDEACRNQARLAPDLRRSSQGIISAARSMAADESLLIVIDRFEEVLARNRDRAGDFVRLLLTTVHEPAAPVYIALALRSEHVGDSSRFPDLPEALNVSQYLLPRMTREQRREAIEGPLWPVRMEPRLLLRLLNETPADVNELSALQNKLRRTWENWEQRGDRRLAIDLPDYL